MKVTFITIALAASQTEPAGHESWTLSNVWTLVETDHITLLCEIIVVLLIVLLVGFWQYRRNIRWLMYQRDENARQIVLKSAKISRLEKNGESNEQEIAKLRRQVEEHQERISARMLIGAKLFLRLQQKEPISDCTPDERQCLVEYFAQLRPKCWHEWQTKYRDLTTSQLIFLILQNDLHYDDGTIASVLGVKPSSLRTTRSRMRLRKVSKRD